MNYLPSELPGKPNANFLLWNEYIGGDDGKDSSYKLLGSNYSILLWNIYHLEFSAFLGFYFWPNRSYYFQRFHKSTYSIVVF